MRVDHQTALGARLCNIGPAVPGLPLSLALRALEFSEAALRSLVRSHTLFAWSSLRTVLNVVALLEAQVASIRHSFGKPLPPDITQLLHQVYNFRNIFFVCQTHNTVKTLKDDQYIEQSSLHDQDILMTYTRQCDMTPFTADTASS